MTETYEEYRKRLDGYVLGQDPLRIQRDTPAALARLVGDASPERLRRRPAPDKWSVAEILAHMAEDEIATAWRYRQMIEHSGATLSGFDQDLWARLGRYEAWSARDALELFRLLREANLRMLDALSEDQWQRSGHHVERGPMTVRDLARQMAGHDVNHLRQIEALLR